MAQRPPYDFFQIRAQACERLLRVISAMPMLSSDSSGCNWRNLYSGHGWAGRS
jgi:hypothetical protein